MKPLFHSVIALIGLCWSTASIAQGTQTTPCNATGSTSTTPTGTCSGCTINRTTNITSNFIVTTGQTVCVTAPITITASITIQNGGILSICPGGSISYGGGGNNTYPIIVQTGGILNNHNIMTLSNGNDNSASIISNDGRLNNYGEIEINHGQNQLALISNTGVFDNATSGLIDVNMGNDGYFDNCGMLLNSGEISIVGGNGGSATLVNCPTGIIMFYNGSSFIANGNLGNAGTIENQGGFFCNQGSMCNDITIGLTAGQINCVSALPIEVVNFQVTCDDAQANQVITWQTSSEFNSSHFIVLKSNDNEAWEEIGRIPAAGNSSKLIDYEFYDSRFSPELSYYRLEQVDNDGLVRSYESVGNKCTNLEEVIIFPNPNSGDFDVYVSSLKHKEGILFITNLNGKIVEQKPFDFEGSNSMVSFEGLNIENGMYILNIKTNGQIINRVPFIKN